MKSSAPLKLFVGASAGGHANELLIVLDAAKGLWPVEPAAYVTTLDITAKAFAQRGKPVYVVGESDRRNPLRACVVLVRTLWLALRCRPDVVVTTGSMPLALFCLWAKLFGARIVWIDSIAQIEHLSASGRLARRFADLCLSQWPDVAAQYPGVEYAGEVF